MHDVITSLREERCGYAAVVNETERFHLSYADFRALPLKEGDTLDFADFRQKLHAQQYPAALNRAVGFLAARARSCGEVRRKLEGRGYLPETIDAVLMKLQKESLLDDAAFAKAWVQARSTKQLGKVRIRQELRQKGIDDAIAQEALDALERDDTDVQALQLARKLLKRHQSEPPRDALRKALAAMQRRGYAYGEASRALQAAIEQSDE